MLSSNSNSIHHKGSQTLAGPCFVPDPTFAAKRAGIFFRHQPAGNGGSRTLTEINTAILGKSLPCTHWLKCDDSHLTHLMWHMSHMSSQVWPDHFHHLRTPAKVKAKHPSSDPMGRLHFQMAVFFLWKTVDEAIDWGYACVRYIHLYSVSIYIPSTSQIMFIYAIDILSWQ